MQLLWSSDISGNSGEISPSALHSVWGLGAQIYALIKRERVTREMYSLIQLRLPLLEPV